MRPTILFLSLLLVSVALNAQDWRPFQYSKSVHYQLGEDYEKTDSLGTNLVVSANELLKLQLEDSMSTSSGMRYMTYDIFNGSTNSGIDVCIKMEPWPGEIEVSNGAWMSNLGTGHVLRWPHPAVALDTFMAISQDTVLMISLDTLTEDTVLGVMDSIGLFTTELVVNNQPVSSHPFSDLQIVLSKNHGMVFGLLPIAFPGSIVLIELVAFEDRGLASGVTLAGIYDLYPDDKLHYKRIVNNGYWNGDYEHPSAIIETRDLLTVLTRTVDPNSHEPTYTVRRERSQSYTTYVVNSYSNGVVVDSVGIESQTDTITWDGANDLESFFLQRPPRRADLNSAVYNPSTARTLNNGHLQLKYDEIGGLYGQLEECGMHFYTGEGYGYYTDIQVQQPYGLMYKYTGGINDYIGNYQSDVLNLVYYKGVHEDYGQPLWPLMVPDIEAKSADVSVFPNPSRDQVFIQSDNRVKKATIHDQRGRIVLSQELASAQRLNIADLEAGIYLLTIELENEVVSKKLVKTP